MSTEKILLNHTAEELIGNYIYNYPNHLYLVRGQDGRSLKLQSLETGEVYNWGNHLLDDFGRYNARVGVYFKKNEDAKINTANFKYIKIIRKINTMDNKRKELGYKTYYTT